MVVMSISVRAACGGFVATGVPWIVTLKKIMPFSLSSTKNDSDPQLGHFISARLLNRPEERTFTKKNDELLHGQSALGVF
jgi:hypothetical protein